MIFNILFLSLQKNPPPMKYIGNIVTRTKLEINEFFLITDNLENIDKTVPTLIVGWSLVKELYPDQDILTPTIDENISWTFGKREKRYKHEIDIEEFIKKCAAKMSENVNYKFFNYLMAAPEKRKKFVEFINRGGCYIYHNSRFAYIYNPNSKMTIGISLVDLRYVDVKIKSFLSMLNIEGNNLVVNNLDFLSEDSLYLIKDNIKAASYLNYLKNPSIY